MSKVCVYFEGVIRKHIPLLDYPDPVQVNDVGRFLNDPGGQHSCCVSLNNGLGSVIILAFSLSSAGVQTKPATKPLELIRQQSLEQRPGVDS